MKAKYVQDGTVVTRGSEARCTQGLVTTSLTRTKAAGMPKGDAPGPDSVHRVT